ncbi:MAG: GDP-L-fucose synthase family protein [Candidatus Hodarchaeales archaeon]
MSKDWQVYVTGHTGMVGRALIPQLKSVGYSNILLLSSKKLDLSNQNEVDDFFCKNNPEIVIHLAAKVGGIIANIREPASFIYDNLMIQTNVIHSAHKYGCKKLIFLGSSCIYPRNAPQPMKEDYFLTGKLEPTNQSYAIAKIAGIQMCQSYAIQHKDNFITPLPCNLYGPGDHYDDEYSHVLAALISRFHEAKSEERDLVTVWGSGLPRREFLFVNDLVEAIIFLLEKYNTPEIINVGTGYDISIKELAEKISDIIGYSGEIRFDKDQPDGMMHKLLDVSKINELGWRARTPLDEGIEIAYKEYIKQKKCVE